MLFLANGYVKLYRQLIKARSHFNISPSTFSYDAPSFAHPLSQLVIAICTHALNKHVIPMALADGFGSYMGDGGPAESRRA